MTNFDLAGAPFICAECKKPITEGKPLRFRTNDQGQMEVICSNHGSVGTPKLADEVLASQKK